MANPDNKYSIQAQFKAESTTASNAKLHATMEIPKVAQKDVTKDRIPVYDPVASGRKIERDPAELWKEKQAQPALVGPANDPKTQELKRRIEDRLSKLLPAGKDPRRLAEFCIKALTQKKTEQQITLSLKNDLKSNVVKFVSWLLMTAKLYKDGKDMVLKGEAVPSKRDESTPKMGYGESVERYKKQEAVSDSVWVSHADRERERQRLERLNELKAQKDVESTLQGNAPVKDTKDGETSAMYRAFMKAEVNRLKQANPGVDHKDLFSLAQEWHR